MIKNRNTQLFGTIVLIVAAILVTLSAVRPPTVAPAGLSWPPRPAFSHFKEKAHVPITGNGAGLAQYYRSERGMTALVQSSLDVYYQSERMRADNSAGSSDPPLYRYHQSEWFGK